MSDQGAFKKILNICLGWLRVSPSLIWKRSDGAASEDGTKVPLPLRKCLWALVFRMHRKERLAESQRKRSIWGGRVSCGLRRG